MVRWGGLAGRLRSAAGLTCALWPRQPRQADGPSHSVPACLPACHPPTPHAALVRDLRELPSKQALQLRSDAATTAAALGSQRSAAAKLAQRLAKQYGI